MFFHLTRLSDSDDIMDVRNSAGPFFEKVRWVTQKVLFNGLFR
jgi:hypothetical protein